MNPEIAAKIDAFLEKLSEYINGKLLPFTLSMTDPSGNSFVQNPNSPKPDPHVLKFRYFP